MLRKVFAALSVLLACTLAFVVGNASPPSDLVVDDAQAQSCQQGAVRVQCTGIGCWNSQFPTLCKLNFCVGVGKTANQTWLEPWMPPTVNYAVYETTAPMTGVPVPMCPSHFQVASSWK